MPATLKQGGAIINRRFYSNTLIIRVIYIYTKINSKKSRIMSDKYFILFIFSFTMNLIYF